MTKPVGISFEIGQHTDRLSVRQDSVPIWMSDAPETLLRK